MPKNIVVMSDGTGQEGGKGNNTNVYKLFNMAEDRTDHQIVYYDAGIGTGRLKIMTNAGGLGIKRKVLQAYQFIFDHYADGDRIFLFGFSRGATTVRSLSSFIDCFGILPRSRPGLIADAFKIYRIKNREQRTAKAKEFIERNHTMWCRVHFLGVWDTVAALGVPFGPLDKLVNRIPGLKHDFYDLKLSDSVENAYHALAIDDERLTFHPTLFRKDVKSHQKVKQVWFCGMHTDVGGGYAECDLSDIALEWMAKHALDHGFLFYSKNKVKLAPKATGIMHDSRSAGLTKLFRRKPRAWDAKTNGEIVLHQSVVERREAGGYGPWVFNEKYEVDPWVPPDLGRE